MFPSVYNWAAITANVKGVLSENIIFYGLMLYLAMEFLPDLIGMTKSATSPETDGDIVTIGKQSYQRHESGKFKMDRSGRMVPVGVWYEKASYDYDEDDGDDYDDDDEAWVR